MSNRNEAPKRLLSSIKLNARQRKVYDQDEIVKLAESIRRTKGLIHPIVIDPEDESLVAGNRRLLAYIHLMSRYPDEGWEEIPFIYKGQESDLFRKICELEENLQRVNLEWWEEAAAINEIDELQRQLAAESGETWSMRKTAEMVGRSLGTVQNSKDLVKAVKKDPSIKKEKTLTGALNKIKVQKKIEERKKEIEKKNSGMIVTFPAEIIPGDARELIKKEPDSEYDAIITNFPFGVGYKTREGERLYHDEEVYISELVRDVVKEGYRVLKDNSWFIGFFDVRKITYSNFVREYIDLTLPIIKQHVKDEEKLSHLLNLASLSMGLAGWFEEAGFSYIQLVPNVWVKPNKRQGIIGDPKKGKIVAYEAFIFAGKGDPILLKQGLQNIYICDTPEGNERDFGMQMPRELCAKLVAEVSLGGGKILDPFAGVGSFGEGALDNQCSFRGFELNEERARIGNLRLQEHFYARSGGSQNEEPGH